MMVFILQQRDFTVSLDTGKRLDHGAFEFFRVAGGF
jgi:hypothetical protein